MTAQIIANPPGSITNYESGARIPVEPGVVYQIADVDESTGVGPILDPMELGREIVGEDVQITLPDGTVLIFEGLVALLAEGTAGGLAGPGGEVVIASIEALIAPAANGEQTNSGEAGDGSSQAFNQAQISDPRTFGEAGEGEFNGLGQPGFGGQEENENNPLLNAAAATSDGPVGPTAGNDIVITADDGRIIVLARAVLANDSGTGLKIVSVQDYTGPGAVSVDANGNIVIEQVAGNPAADNSGTRQTLTYTVEDANGNTSTGEILIYVDEFNSVNGFIQGPDDLGNDVNEIYIADAPANPNNPLGTVVFFGGDEDDFFQIRDEQDFRAFGGDGFDTLLADAEFSSDFMDFHLQRKFNLADNSIERIDASDEVSNFGTVRILAQNPNTNENWNFTGIDLIGIDEINTGSGNDRVVGSAGNDTIVGGSGNDTLKGAGGNDRINGGFNDDSIDGGTGNDTLFGDGGADRITGGSGDDSIFGGTGTDTINGGAGNDFIDIGANDVNSERIIISDRADGIDTIANFDNVAGTQDVLDLDALFDDLAADLGVALDSAARAGRVSVVQDGANTNVFVDQSAAGNGSDLVQIAIVQDTASGNFDVGAAGTDDIFVGA